jgi:hypothetical protein
VKLFEIDLDRSFLAIIHSRTVAKTVANFRDPKLGWSLFRNWAIGAELKKLPAFSCIFVPSGCQTVAKRAPFACI